MELHNVSADVQKPVIRQILALQRDPVDFFRITYAPKQENGAFPKKEAHDYEFTKYPAYIGGGSFGFSFIGFLTKHRVKWPISLKVIPYQTDYEYFDGENNEYNTQHPVEVEYQFLRQLQELNTQKICPQIPIFYFSKKSRNFISKFTEIAPFTECIRRMSFKIAKKITNFESQPDIRMTFVEYCSEGNMHRFIQRLNNSNLDENQRNMLLKSIVFQVIWAISCMQNHFKNFRHNDLYLPNILVTRTDVENFLTSDNTLEINVVDNNYKTKKNEYHVYQFKKDKVFYVQTFGYIAKIWDFDYANADCELLRNDKVNDQWSARWGISPKPNPMFDIHLFLNTLHNEKIPTETREFIERVIPSNYRGKKNKFTEHRRLSKYRIVRECFERFSLPKFMRAAYDCGAISSTTYNEQRETYDYIHSKEFYNHIRRNYKKSNPEELKEIYKHEVEFKRGEIFKTIFGKSYTRSFLDEIYKCLLDRGEPGYEKMYLIGDSFNDMNLVLKRDHDSEVIYETPEEILQNDPYFNCYLRPTYISASTPFFKYNKELGYSELK